MNPHEDWAGRETGTQQIRASKHVGSAENTREKAPHLL